MTRWRDSLWDPLVAYLRAAQSNTCLSSAYGTCSALHAQVLNTLCCRPELHLVSVDHKTRKRLCVLCIVMVSTWHQYVLGLVEQRICCQREIEAARRAAQIRGRFITNACCSQIQFQLQFQGMVRSGTAWRCCRTQPRTSCVQARLSPFGAHGQAEARNLSVSVYSDSKFHNSKKRVASLNLQKLVLCPPLNFQ